MQTDNHSRFDCLSILLYYLCCTFNFLNSSLFDGVCFVTNGVSDNFELLGARVIEKPEFLMYSDTSANE